MKRILPVNILGALEILSSDLAFLVVTDLHWEFNAFPSFAFDDMYDINYTT